MAKQEETGQPSAQAARPRLELGAFSVSLSVKDLNVSQEFYSKLGFERIGGEPSQHWVILRNGTTVLGLFQGMFERNMLTFNPGWDAQQNVQDGFTDVRELEQAVKAAGLDPVDSVGAPTGPGSFTLLDPDGNPILLDQHV